MDEYNLWEPSEDIPYGDLYFLGIKDDSSELTISLGILGSERTLEVKFSAVLGYRITQESARLRSLGESVSLNRFRTSLSSDFLNWFKEESLNLFDELELTHYVICNTDNIIDVITGNPVTTKWIDLR